jgi:hypothetical protein
MKAVPTKHDLKTIKEWADNEGIVVLDPDGFDRTDPELMTRKFSYKDFCKGILRSTICMPTKGIIKIIDEDKGQP